MASHKLGRALAARVIIFNNVMSSAGGCIFVEVDIYKLFDILCMYFIVYSIMSTTVMPADTWLDERLILVLL